MTSKQIDKLLTILDRFATVAERWSDREYPNAEDTDEEAYIGKRGERGEPQSKEDYDALPEVEGRFEKRYRESNTKA